MKKGSQVKDVAMEKGDVWDEAMEKGEGDKGQDKEKSSEALDKGK